MYQKLHVCEQIYISETEGGIALRWEEYENIYQDSEPAKWQKNLSKLVKASEIVLIKSKKLL